MQQKAGFIGLGIMGAPMAENLLRAGVALGVSDVVEAAVARLTGQGAVRMTAEQMAAECGVIFLMLPNGTIVKNVLFGENGLAQHLRPGALVVDMSSVSPIESRDCAGRLEALGVSFLDAPVSGGEEGAIRGSLAIMAGGSEESFLRAKPFFEILGTEATLVGGAGSGSVAKLANQIIVNLNIAALSEALVFAKKAGAEPQKVFEAIRGGLAGSQVMEDKAPRMIARNFKPGGKIAVNHKDIRNVLDTAHQLDVPVPMSAGLFEMMQALRNTGHFQEDHSAIIKYFEMLSGLES